MNVRAQRFVSPKRLLATSSVLHRLGLAQRVKAVTAILIAAAAIIQAVVVIAAGSHVIESNHRDRAAERLADTSARITERVEVFRGAPLLLESTPTLQSLVDLDAAGAPGDSDAVARERARMTWIVDWLMRTNPDIHRVRIIGAVDGRRELLRVERIGGEIVVADPAELGEVDARELPFDVLALPSGEVLTTAIEPDALDGAIVSPARPTIRVMTPVLSPDGEALGAIVVQADVRRWLTATALTSDPGDGFVVYDDAGDAVIGSSGEPLFASRLGLNAPPPRRWSRIEALLARAHGETAFASTPQGRVVARHLAYDPERPERRLTLLTVAPPTGWFGAKPWLIGMALALAAILACAGLLAGYLVSRPLSHLLRTAKAIAAGEIGPESVADAAEEHQVRELTEALEVMRAAVERRDASVRASEERFALAARASSVGIYDRMDLSQPAAYWSDQLYAMIGYERGELFPSHETFTELLHPDDREKVERRRKAHLERREPYRLEYRLKHKTKGYRWFLGTLQAGWDEQGNPERFTGSIMDIHDLKVAQERAEAASVAKSTFLANMSHEIRTPLNGVKGMASALAATPLTPRQRDMLDVINQAGDTLLHVINDILDISKIEAGKYVIDRVPFDLAELVESVERLHALKANDKGLGFRITLEDGADGRYLGDPERIRQVLNNLVSNALKFTEAGEVTCRVWRAPAAPGDANGAATLHFEVADTGPGISKDDLARLFTPFTQADSSNTRKHQGTGLGLSISKQLCELMGGAIAVKSAPGTGSRFTFHVALAEAGAAADTERTRDTVEEAQDAPTAATPAAPAARPAPTSADESAEKLGDERAASEDAAARPLRMLIVDDVEMNAMVLDSLLEPLGGEHVIVDSGPAAIAAWETAPFDVILMDIRMPGMDGIAATRAIRRREDETSRPRTPILAVTADALNEQVAAYLAAGLDAHIPKPVDQRQLFKEVLSALESRGPGARPNAAQA